MTADPNGSCRKKVARTLREVHQLEVYETTKRACDDEGLTSTGTAVPSFLRFSWGRGLGPEVDTILDPSKKTRK